MFFVLAFAIQLITVSIVVGDTANCVRGQENADYAFAVDSSGSILQSEFTIVKDFVKDVVDHLSIGPDLTHVGLIEYSTSATMPFNFDESYDKQKIKDLVDAVDQQAGITRIDLALKVASEQLFTPEGGMRPNSTKIMVLITDGNQTGTDLVPWQTPLVDAIQPLKDLGVKVLAIAVGSVDRKQLSTLTESPDYILTAPNFATLTSLVRQTVKKSCRDSKGSAEFHGGWTSWSVSKPCSVTCGSGVEIVSRTCTNPAPKHGGNSCSGSAQKQRACTKNPCPMCGQENADYAFVVDTSGSILEGEFIIVKDFVKDVVDHLSIGPDLTHVGLIEYSTRATMPFNFVRSYDKQRIKDLVDAVDQSRGITRIDLALKVATEQLFTPEGGMRPNSRKVMVLITDGNQTGTNLIPDQTPLVDAIQPLKDLGVKVLAIAIGSVDRKQLSTLAESPDYILTAPNFATLTSLVRQTVKKSCRDSKVHGGWTSWSVSKPCSVTCGSGVEIVSRTCTNPVPKHGGNSCSGSSQKQQACTKNPCPTGLGCYGHFPSVLLGSFTDEIDWFTHFPSQMQAMVKKCAHLAVKKRQRYFGVDGSGNCYGAQHSPSGAKVTKCNFGAGLDNYYYVYEVSL